MKRLVFLIIIIVILIYGYLSVFTLKQTDYVILTEFGKPIGTPIKEPGLHFKLPYQTVNRISRQVNILKTQPIQLLLKDKNPVVITCYICWKISDPFIFFQSVTTKEMAVQKIGDLINDNMASTLGRYNVNNIINDDAEQVKLTNIENESLVNANKLAKAKYGIDLIEIGIRRLNYPQIVAESVYNRMRAEREKEAKKYRAEGMEEAAKIEAETDKEVSNILSKAYKESEIIKGEGDKKSIETYAAAYSKDPEFFEFIKSIETYSDVLKNKSTLILSTESELFKFLNKLNQEK